MTDREIMQQALDAMERYQVKRQDFDRFAGEIAALRERLAQPEQESVKFNCTVVDDAHPEGVPLGQWGKQQSPAPTTGNVLMDAYHAMQAKKHAARTTDRGPVAWLPPDPPPECKSEAEKTAFAFGWFKALEAQRAAREEAIYETIIQWDEGGGKRSRRELARRIVDLYTTPPQRKPLTHEQRVDLLAKFEAHKHKWHAPAILIDMVEAAHGIKE